MSSIKERGLYRLYLNLTNGALRLLEYLCGDGQLFEYILSNQTYTGKVLWGWRHADYEKTKQRRLRGQTGLMEDGVHEPIVSSSVFQLAQKEKKLRKTAYKGRANISRGLLTGIAKCIRCGSGVTYKTRRQKRSHLNSNWHDTTFHEYNCSGYKYSGICQQKVMGATKLENFVLSQIKNIINSPTARERLIFDRTITINNNLQDDYAYAQKSLLEIPRKRQRQQEAYEAGMIPLEKYGRY